MAARGRLSEHVEGGGRLDRFAGYADYTARRCFAALDDETKRWCRLC